MWLRLSACSMLACLSLNPMVFLLVLLFSLWRAAFFLGGGGPVQKRTDVQCPLVEEREEYKVVLLLYSRIPH
jgi:hypothetical protein